MGKTRQRQDNVVVGPRRMASMPKQIIGGAME